MMTPPPTTRTRRQQVARWRRRPTWMCEGVRVATLHSARIMNVLGHRMRRSRAESHYFKRIMSTTWLLGGLLSCIVAVVCCAAVNQQSCHNMNKCCISYAYLDKFVIKGRRSVHGDDSATRKSTCHNLVAVCTHTHAQCTRGRISIVTACPRAYNIYYTIWLLSAYELRPTIVRELCLCHCACVCVFLLCCKPSAIITNKQRMQGYDVWRLPGESRTHIR